MLENVYTVQEIAKKFKLSRSGAYKFVHSLPEGLIINLGERIIRIDKQGFDEYIKAINKKKE